MYEATLVRPHAHSAYLLQLSTHFLEAIRELAQGVLLHQDGLLTHLGGELLRFAHGSILSRALASTNAEAVQLATK